jgi:3-hydroxyisobutyrate dehydrogenase-like beta-hydroxyacid dehydrogenase/MFS family permease
MGGTFSSLRARNFRLFVIGQLISNSGNWLTTVASALLVLHRTGSGVDVGVLAACQYGPVLLLSAWGGLIADRSDKRRLIFLTQSAEMAESFVLAALAFSPSVPLGAFFLTGLAGGSILAFDNPGRRSFVNEMVQARDLPNAVNLYSAMAGLSRIMGPTLAAALIISLGYGWCFIIDGLSYLAVLFALLNMRVSELRPTPIAQRGRGQIRSGIRYVLGVAELRISFATLLIIGVASYNFTVTFPLFIERGLHGSDVQYTLFYAAFSAGGVLATVLIARRTRATLRSVMIGAAGLGMAMVALFFAPNVAAAYPLACVLGGAAVVYVTSTTAVVQLQDDRTMIGRVIALQTALQLGTTPVGGPILGFVADAWGGRAPILIGGIAALAAAALGVAGGRRHRTVQTSSGPGHDDLPPCATADMAPQPTGPCGGQPPGEILEQTKRSFHKFTNEVYVTVTSSLREQQIGIVGVGNMGGAIARSILRHEFKLNVFDIKPEAVEEIVALGGKATASLQELAASSDVISVVVVSDDQVREVGAAIIGHARQGTAVLVHSTVRPSTMVELGEAAARRGIQVLDVSVNGGAEKASRGTLTLMVGGDEATANRLWPLFTAFGESVFYMGPTGSGVVAKLINNLIAVGSYALQLEGMRLGAAYGLQEDAITTAVIASQGDCKGIRTWGRHDRKRAIRAAQGVDWSARMGRDLQEAAIAAGLRGEMLSITSVIADAMPSMLRRRDRDVAAREPGPEAIFCDVCGQDLAASFREAGIHPECRKGYWHSK